MKKYYYINLHALFEELLFLPDTKDPTKIQIQGKNIQKSFSTSKPGGIHIRLDPDCKDHTGCKWNKG